MHDELPENEFVRKGVWLNVRLPPVGYAVPQTLKEAMADEYWPAWRLALDAEWNVLKQKGTMEVVLASEMPPGQKPIPFRIVFDVKRDSNGVAYKCKARVVAKGFHEVSGRDYFDVYSAVVNIKALRMCLAIWCLSPDHHAEQWDATVAFFMQ